MKFFRSHLWRKHELSMKLQMVTGSVGDLRQVKEAISVARAVMDHTHHALIVGESATNFAVEMGFHTESLTSNYSKQLYTDWKGNNCQPNYWHDVVPDPKYNCGPYTPEKKSSRAKCKEKKQKLR